MKLRQRKQDSKIKQAEKNHVFNLKTNKYALHVFFAISEYVLELFKVNLVAYRQNNVADFD